MVTGFPPLSFRGDNIMNALADTTLANGLGDSSCSVEFMIHDINYDRSLTRVGTMMLRGGGHADGREAAAPSFESTQKE